MRDFIVSWCDRHFVENWRGVFKRAWSVRIVAFWSLIGGVVILLPLVSDEAKAIVGPWLFAIIFLANFITFNIARALKQPGTEQ